MGKINRDIAAKNQGKTRPIYSKSYHPVSLSSCLCIVMERILSNRLPWFLESKGKINWAPAGFRRGCSTMDHVYECIVFHCMYVSTKPENCYSGIVREV